MIGHPTAGLVEEVRVSPEDIRGLAEDGLGWTILAGLVHPGGLLCYLRDHGISADQLWEAAEDIRVMEGAGLEPLAKANTAPRPHPSNPSPNKAGTKSKPAAPGFPSGDN